MSPDKFLRGLVQNWCAEKPGRGREFGADRSHEACSIVPRMDCQALSRIASANEQERSAGGITVNDGAADPQLRLS